MPQPHSTSLTAERHDLGHMVPDVATAIPCFPRPAYPLNAVPLAIYQSFAVKPIVAFAADGLPISPVDLAEIAAVRHEPTTEHDPNVSSWGVYGVRFNGELASLCDCATREIAEAIGASLQHCFRRNS